MPNIKKQLYELLERGFEGHFWSKFVSGFIVLLIIANVSAVILESYAPIGEKYSLFFSLFNLFSVAVFTVEYIARVWVSTESKAYKSRIQYIVSPIALIDFLAIAPFYLSFIFAIDLRYLRMLRMLRLLKLTHYFNGIRLFIDVLKKELPSIGAAIMIMAVLVILSAGIIYSVEQKAQPEVFDSIPSAIWWSVVTMTTVGYGDVTPVTFLGKFISIFIMLLGVGVVALPAAMLAAKFGDELRTKRKHLEQEIASALEDGVISRSEKTAINDICDSMGVSSEELEQLIRHYQDHKNQIIVCEKCGNIIEVKKP
ncbi:ion transporter [Thalassotalea aquiviva]|uniref:ion transporter n=1 Tax=Thalassotalea aquiviva TaxID=3242415 RepID=UPI00352BA381